MESSAPAAVPWVVLVVALLALAGSAALWLTHRQADRRAPTALPAGPRSADAGPRAVRYADDDLPGFLDAPPGTPGAEARVAPPQTPADPGPQPAVEDGASGARVVAAMATVALVLVAVLAGVAVTEQDDAPPPAPAAGTTAPPLPPATTAPTSTRSLPEFPGVPADPLPGEGGAGVLANRSVPLGGDGVSARLAFGGLVVERHAVGVLVGYPSVSVTATGGPGGASAALAHVRMPTWNCMSAEPPADPDAAGCIRAATEYADLPSPALTVTRDGGDVRLTGRFPSYTRPVATAPAYTGRVYDLTVTASPSGPVREGRAPATATLFLGTDRVGSLDEPGLTAVRYAG